MSGFRKPGQHGAPSLNEWAAQADAPLADPARPWLSADPQRTQQFLARMPAPLHAKLAWLKANLPGGPSIQQQVLNAAEEYANRMIAELEEQAAHRNARRRDGH